MQWDPERMSTGDASVDAQHLELIKRINELHRACTVGAGREKVQSMIDFLGEYAVNHFRHEEGVMDSCRCPARAANRTAHQQFLKAFTELKQRFEFEGSKTGLLIQLKKMVSEWLVNHICTIDTQLRECPRTCETPSTRRLPALIRS